MSVSIKKLSQNKLTKQSGQMSCSLQRRACRQLSLLVETQYANTISKSNMMCILLNVRRLESLSATGLLTVIFERQDEHRWQGRLIKPRVRLMWYSERVSYQMSSCGMIFFMLLHSSLSVRTRWVLTPLKDGHPNVISSLSMANKAIFWNCSVVMRAKTTTKELPSTHDVWVYIYNKFVKHLESLMKAFKISREQRSLMKNLQLS